MKNLVRFFNFFNILVINTYAPRTIQSKKSTIALSESLTWKWYSVASIEKPEKGRKYWGHSLNDTIDENGSRLIEFTCRRNISIICLFLPPQFSIYTRWNDIQGGWSWSHWETSAVFEGHCDLRAKYRCRIPSNGSSRLIQLSGPILKTSRTLEEEIL